MRRRSHALIALAALAWLAACSRPEPASAPPPAEPPAAQSTVSVTDVDLGRSVGADRRIADRTDSFGTGDTIYASVVTSGSAPSATLRARWTYQDGQVVDESTQTIAPTGSAVTEFHIAKPGGWPAGSYKVEIFLNGSSVRTKEFKVG